MALFSYKGVDYDTPAYPIQNDPSATSLDATKIPTGQTVEGYLNSKIQDNASATDLENTKLPTGQTVEGYLNSRIQDDSTATDLTNDKLPTGQTIESYVAKQKETVVLPTTAGTAVNSMWIEY